MSIKLVLRSLAILALFSTCGSLRLAAQDAPSVAEAARRAREKKQAATKPTTVITDDTLHPRPAVPAGEADANAPATHTAAGTAAPAEGNVAESAPKKQPSEAEDAEKKEKLEALKREIAEKQESVNLLQREITLEQSNFYRNPDYSHDTAGKAKIDAMQSDLQQQQSALADLKAKFADMGGVEGPKTPAPAQPQS
jgi:chemotaxis protein histidine kinase CheA